jgi:hypothetical protein
MQDKVHDKGHLLLYTHGRRPVGQGTFPKCRAEFGYHLILGHFFFFLGTCPLPQAFTPTKKKKKKPKHYICARSFQLCRPASFFFPCPVLLNPIHRGPQKKKKKDGWKLSRHTLDPMLCGVWACKWCSKPLQAQN